MLGKFGSERKLLWACFVLWRRFNKGSHILQIPGGGGDVPYHMDGGTRRKLWKEPLRGTMFLFVGRGLDWISSSRRGTNSKTTHFCNIALKRIVSNIFCSQS